MPLLSAALAMLTRPFDAVARFWSSGGAAAMRAWTLATVFLGSIALIEANRQGWLPEPLAERFPNVNHLAAIGWAVSVLLVFELVQLTLSLARSVAGTLGVHIEVYSLILLRDAFLQLTSFGEPLETEGHLETTLSMLSDALGAVILFAIVNLYSRMQRHMPITRDDASQERFVAIKKVIGLALLAALVLLLARDAVSIADRGEPIRIFDIFFTALVFVDVLLAFVSLGFSSSHPVVFRNFGFAFVAVMLRLALASDDFYRPAIGVIAGVIAVGVTWAYNDALKPARVIREPASAHSDHAVSGADPPSPS